jgi:hypothetical protein
MKKADASRFARTQILQGKHLRQPRIRHLACGVAAVALALLWFSSGVEAKPPRKLGVCQAIAGAARFNGSYVSIRGRVKSNGIEYTDLTSPSCPKAIALWPSKAAFLDPGYKAVQAVIRCPLVGTKGKTIDGVFTGRFQWKPGKIPEWRFRFDRVSNLHIEVESCGLSLPGK